MCPWVGPGWQLAVSSRQDTGPAVRASGFSCHDPGQDTAHLWASASSSVSQGAGHVAEWILMPLSVLVLHAWDQEK